MQLQYKARRFDLKVLEASAGDVAAAAVAAGRVPTLHEYATGAPAADGRHRTLQIQLMIRPRKTALAKLQKAPGGVDSRPPALRQG